MLNFNTNMRMNRLPALLLGILVVLAYPAAAQQIRIGYVNAGRIERESKRVERGVEALKKEFAVREQALQELRIQVLTMQSELEKLKPDTQPAELNRKQREFSGLAQRLEQGGRAFTEDLERRKAEERQKFDRDVTVVVRKIAGAQKLDLVVQEAVYATAAIDITNQVLKALDGLPAGAGK